MYDDFKIANYSNSLVSPEFYARPLSRLFKGDVIDGLTVVPGTGLKVTLQPGNAMLRYGSAAAASARMVSLVADFSLDIPAPDASNPRIDAVVLYVDNSVNLPIVDASNPPTSANLDGPGVAKARIVSGTPAANPVAPTDVAVQAAVGAGNPYTVLENVQVDPGVSVIASNKITDRRNWVKLATQVTDEKWRNGVSFRARMTIGHTATSTPSVIPWNSKDYDLGDNYASSYFTAPVDGIYSFSVSVYAEAGVTDRMYLDVVGTSGIIGIIFDETVSRQREANASFEGKLLAGQTVGISIYSASSTNIGHGARTWFAGHLVTRV